MLSFLQLAILIFLSFVLTVFYSFLFHSLSSPISTIIFLSILINLINLLKESLFCCWRLPNIILISLFPLYNLSKINLFLFNQRELLKAKFSFEFQSKIYSLSHLECFQFIYLKTKFNQSIYQFFLHRN